jgi:hypothetical protein
MPEYGIIVGTGLLGIFTGNSVNPGGFIGLNNPAMQDSRIVEVQIQIASPEVIISGQQMSPEIIISGQQVSPNVIISGI